MTLEIEPSPISRSMIEHSRAEAAFSGGYVAALIEAARLTVDRRLEQGLLDLAVCELRGGLGWARLVVRYEAADEADRERYMRR